MIYVFVAHPDDLIIGCGGSVAKYAHDKKKVTSVIFSYGENRNPILDPAYLTKKLITASKKALKVLGSRIILLGLPDSKLKKNINSEIKKKIKKLLRKNPPQIIVVHDISDPHPKHRTVTKFILGLVKDLKFKPRIYTFVVDLPFKLVQRELPTLYVDISHTYATKQRAIELFKSHAEINPYQEFIGKFRSTINGLRIGAKQAEVFYKL